MVSMWRSSFSLTHGEWECNLEWLVVSVQVVDTCSWINFATGEYRERVSGLGINGRDLTLSFLEKQGGHRLWKHSLFSDQE